MKSSRYEYHEVIGEGGMATVYRGTQTSLNRPVAIKVLAATLNDNEQVKKRFKRESLIIARLNHPNIVNVIDKGMTSQGRPVFVMELLEGHTLKTLIQEGSLSFSEKVSVAVQLCKGLAYAHKLDVIHRDIKPSNIIVSAERFVKILDFGIASFFESGQLQSEDEDIVMGTEAYMAPEQKQGLGHATKVSDIYSLGMVLFEMFAGCLPSEATCSLDQMGQQISAQLAGLIMDCIEEQEVNRPQSIVDVRNRLLQAVQGQHISKTQASKAGKGLDDKFVLLDVLNENSLGATYLFQDRTSSKLLVIKKRSAKGSGLKEARMLGSLSHKHIAQHYGASENENVFIEVVEYVSGGSLADRLVEPMELETFFNVAVQIASALVFAHQNNIVHGNLRPTNILFDENAVAKLVDFGFDDVELLKRQGRGQFIPPDRGKSELGDIFSLGAIYFHMLCGKPPEFKDSGSLVKPRILTQRDERLQRMLLHMLSWSEKDRPQSMAQVLQHLRDLAKALDIEVDLDDGDSISRSVPRSSDKTIVRATKKDAPKRGLPGLAGLLFISLGLNIYFVMTHHSEELRDVWLWILSLLP